MKRLTILIIAMFLIFGTGCVSEQSNNLIDTSTGSSQEGHISSGEHEEISTEDNSSDGDSSLETEEDSSSKEEPGQDEGLGWTGFF